MKLLMAALPADAIARLASEGRTLSEDQVLALSLRD
jgi:hypothetical protein